MRRIMMAMLVTTACSVPILACSDLAVSGEVAAATLPKPTLTPQQFVELRRTGMRLAAADIQLVRTAGEKGADIRQMARAVKSLSDWGAIMPALFPAGTGPDVVPTRAKNEIWANRADFEQRARDLSDAATRLADAAAANDMSTGRVQWDATWESCNACHDRYRSEASSSR